MKRKYETRNPSIRELMLDQFTPNDLATSIYWLGRLNHRDQDFENSWIARASATLDQFTPNNLAGSIYGLGRLNHRDQDFENSWIARASATLDQFTPNNLATSIYGLCRLNHRDQDFENAWIARASTTLDQFTPNDLATSIYGLGRLNHRDQDFENSLIARASATLDQFTPVQLGVLIYWLGRSNGHDQDFENAWTEIVTTTLDLFTSTQLLLSVEAFNLLNPDNLNIINIAIFLSSINNPNTENNNIIEQIKKILDKLLQKKCKTPQDNQDNYHKDNNDDDDDDSQITRDDYKASYRSIKFKEYKFQSCTKNTPSEGSIGKDSTYDSQNNNITYSLLTYEYISDKHYPSDILITGDESVINFV